MPLSFTLEEYFGSGRQAEAGIYVDVTEEGGQVDLTIGVPAHEHVGRWPEKPIRPNEPLAHDPDGGMVAELALVQQELDHERTWTRMLAEHVDKLHDWCRQAADAHQLDRRLHPTEARALAAALVHYASEAERR